MQTFLIIITWAALKRTAPKRRAIRFSLESTGRCPLKFAVTLSRFLKHRLIWLRRVSFCIKAMNSVQLRSCDILCVCGGGRMDLERIFKVPRFHDNNWRTFRMRSHFSRKPGSSVPEASYSFMSASAFCTVTVRALPWSPSRYRSKMGKYSSGTFKTKEGEKVLKDLWSESRD